MFFSLHKCIVNGNIDKCLEYLDLSKLQQLAVGCSPIRNKNIKNLMKLHMPNLYSVVFENTYITTDFTKTLRKLPQNYV